MPLLSTEVRSWRDLRSSRSGPPPSGKDLEPKCLRWDLKSGGPTPKERPHVGPACISTLVSLLGCHFPNKKRELLQSLLQGQVHTGLLTNYLTSHSNAKVSLPRSISHSSAFWKPKGKRPPEGDSGALLGFPRSCHSRMAWCKWAISFGNENPHHVHLGCLTVSG